MADSGDLSRARICIDFGTALSKASICLDPMLPLEVGVKPLPIGAISGAEHPLLTPSVLYVDEGRLFFGPTAFERARRGVEDQRDPLLSFKTVLGAKNLDEALNSKLRPSVDPTGTFRQRDALALYLAYLDQLIREAIDLAPNIPKTAVNAPRRYTSPVWRPGSGIERVFERIFDESAAISQRLGHLLLGPAGISIAQCRDALDRAVTTAQPGDARLETGVFEPHAAAAAALAFSNTPTRFVVVFDMGAGTTDIAAFEFDENIEPPSLTEIKEARHASALAGDEIDRILIDLMIRKSGVRRGDEEEIKIARVARLAGRELKREMMATGKCSLRLGWGRTINLRVSDLMEDERFRQYLGALAGIIANSLAAVVARAQGEVIDVVIAGGGAHLTFLPALVQRGATSLNTPVKLRIGPLSPSNALYQGVDRSLAGVFPQIAMSVGGALVEMMPAR